MRILTALFALLLFSAGVVDAKKQVETEHFYIIFDTEQEFWANKVVEIAESVWENLAHAYDQLGDYKKIYVFVEDDGDYANGYAIYSKNRISIYTTAWNYRERSADNWIKNVFTHELAHVFSLKSASTNGLQSLRLSKSAAWSNPDLNLAYYYFNRFGPIWWIEGVAQYESYKNGNDQWDTYRDMKLRMAVIEGDLLSLIETNNFSSRGGYYPEMVYNQGMSMMLYIDSTYGEDVAREIGKIRTFPHFNRTLRNALGKRGSAFWREWRDYVVGKYEKVRAKVGTEITGTKILDGGFADYLAIRSPNDKEIAFISNKGNNTGSTKLYVYSTETGETKQITKEGTDHTSSPAVSAMPNGINNPFNGGTYNQYRVPTFDKSSVSTATRSSDDIYLRTRVLWSPDGNSLVYSRFTRGAGGKCDIYVYDLITERERQITWHERTFDPTISPDGKTIAYIQNKGGIENLYLIDITGKNRRRLTNFNDGTQMYTPSWTPDGKNLVMGIFNAVNRDIVMVNAEAECFNSTKRLTDTAHFVDSLNYQEDFNLRLLVSSKAIERDPSLSADGKYLYFSSDRTGIFNIYRMRLDSIGKIEQMTNVLGGAFEPTLSSDGTKMLYTGFTAGNWSIYEMAVNSGAEVAFEKIDRDFSPRFTGDLLFSGSPNSAQYKLGDYKGRFTLWKLMPFLSFAPSFVSDTVGLPALNAGVSITTGDIYGNRSINADFYIQKDFRNSATPSSGMSISSNLRTPVIAGENIDWRPSATMFFARSVIRNADDFSGGKSINEYATSFPIPGKISYINGIDTVAATYRETYEGSFEYDRYNTFFGVNGTINLGRRSTFMLSGMGISDYLNGDLKNMRERYSTRVYAINEGTLGKKKWGSTYNVDITDEFFKKSNDDTSYVMTDDFIQYEELEFEGTPSPVTIEDYYDHYDLFKGFNATMAYRYLKKRSSFSRFNNDFSFFYAGFNLFDVSYNVDVMSAEWDSLTKIILGDSVGTMYKMIGDNNSELPYVTSILEENSFLQFILSMQHSFPMPWSADNHWNGKPKKRTYRDYFSINGFFGTTSKELPEYSYTSQMQFRASRWLKAYPYSCDTVESINDSLILINGMYDPTDINGDGNYKINNASGELDFKVPINSKKQDIMIGNGIIYYNIQYTFHFTSLFEIPALGFNMLEFTVTPFYETANIWNSDWRDFNPSELLPFSHFESGGFSLNSSYLSDCGVRADFLFTFADTWNAYVGFTWAQRLDLDRAFTGLDANGNKEHLPLNRFMVQVQLW